MQICINWRKVLSVHCLKFTHFNFIFTFYALEKPNPPLIKFSVFVQAILLPVNSDRKPLQDETLIVDLYIFNLKTKILMDWKFNIEPWLWIVKLCLAMGCGHAGRCGQGLLVLYNKYISRQFTTWKLKLSRFDDKGYLR